MEDPRSSGNGTATASMVLGIVAVVLSLLYFIPWINFFIAAVNLILSLIGLSCAAKAKNAGFTGGRRSAGYVLSLLALVASLLMLVLFAMLMLF